MNDLDLEHLLKSMPPAAPSAGLRSRVEHELELDSQWLGTNKQRKAAPRWYAPAAWGALGAAAAIAFMTVLPDAPPAADSSNVATATANAANPSGFTPVSSIMPVTTIREVVDAQDQGIQYNSASMPEQHLRLRSVERHAWIDPRDGAEITVETPREDSFVLPVSFQ